MPWIAARTDQQAGPRGRAIFWFTRRFLRHLAGNAARPALAIEPLRLYARLPKLLRAYAGLERATAGLHHLDRRHRALAELKAATITGCPYCIDLGSQVARRWGLTDQELLAMSAHATSPLFGELDRLVLAYAEAMSRAPVEVPDDLVSRLREQLDQVQLLELTHVIALENMRARFNLALGVEAAGFSEGRVCALPEHGLPPATIHPSAGPARPWTLSPSPSADPSPPSGPTGSPPPPSRRKEPSVGLSARTTSSPPSPSPRSP
jgi:4-carboxymuconolactone decarboxylase